MINFVKNKLADFQISRLLKKIHLENNEFSDFFNKSSSFLLIYPEDEKEFKFGEIILKFLIDNNKSVTIFAFEHNVNLIESRNKVKFLTFRNEEISKLNLPVKSLKTRLESTSFDCLVNLNINDSKFYDIVSVFPKAKYRLGFVKTNADKFYNFQIPFQINTENSYRNLLNSLKMF